MSKKLADKTDSIVRAVAVDVVSLASYTSQALELGVFLIQQPCKTAEQEAWMSQQLSTVRALLKRLDDQRTALTKPLLEAKRRVDGMFSPATKPLAECESIIRGKLAGAALGRLEREKAALQLAQEAAAMGNTDRVMDALAMVPESVATIGSSVTYRWAVASVDFAALPEEYKTIDHARLAAVAKAAGAEEPVVPGVRFERTATVRAK